MVHDILYVLHILGMAAIIAIGLYLFINKNLAEETRKKFALYLMSASHIQVLTGFALFFLMLSEVNHMKVGIKMLLAIEIAVVATLYSRKIAKNEAPNPAFLLIVILSAIATTVIAFVL